MDIIPVIDLRQGLVVHARRGERERYQPVNSSLSASSKIDDVVEGLLGLYPFKKIYIADLDAITGQGDHGGQIRQLRQHYPHLEIWLDGGFNTISALTSWELSGVQCVIGSERLQRLAQYHALAGAVRNPVLSLDFSGDRLIGPAGLLQCSADWPREIICMTLDRVGSASGPDLDKLKHLKARHPAGRWYAAGGVRGMDDLAELSEAGLSGALIASALHDGSMDRRRLEAFLG